MQMMEPSAGAEGFESSYLAKDVKLCGRFALSPRGAWCQGILPCSDSEKPASQRHAATVSYTHLTLPTKRIV